MQERPALPPQRLLVQPVPQVLEAQQPLQRVPPVLLAPQVLPPQPAPPPQLPQWLLPPPQALLPPRVPPRQALLLQRVPAPQALPGRVPQVQLSPRWLQQWPRLLLRWSWREPDLLPLQWYCWEQPLLWSPPPLGWCWTLRW